MSTLPSRIVPTVLILIAACSQAAPTVPLEASGSRGEPSAMPTSAEPTESVGVVHPAVQIGLDHAIIGAFLAGRDYTVTTVEPAPDDYRSGAVRVIVSLGEAAAPREWPDEFVCAIYRESDDVTGVAWVADLDKRRVVVFSPQWDGSISCA